jgi:hypothetical protein
MLFMTDAMLTDNHEDNMTGEPDAVKAARPVRKGIERKGLATTPRSQSTLHHECGSTGKNLSHELLSLRAIGIWHISCDNVLNKTVFCLDNIVFV